MFFVALFGAQAAQAQTFKVVHDFGKGTDGQTPFTGLIHDSRGNHYGTTVYGGAGTLGTVYTLGKTGKETVLYSFCSKSNCADGADPEGGVIEDAQGNLFGTTSFGGAHNQGIVFELNSAGKETILYSFKGGNDGQHPSGSLIQDSKGNFYGTTIFGGGSADVGTVFKLGKSGEETVLYGFTGGTDGAKPFAGVMQDAEGNLYGTAIGGGASGNGVIFEVSKAGKESVLYSFTGGADGAAPTSSLIMDTEGNLYGTASAGGNGGGTIFEWSTAGKLIVLYTFCSQPSCADGSEPEQALVQDADGNFYGTTYAGGSDGKGVVFELTNASKEIVLHNFSGTDGISPYGGSLLRDSDGALYGTTSDGGNLSCGEGPGCGVIFKLTP
jgi:uncharacterized repeat protein (TIGR03803 family)